MGVGIRLREPTLLSSAKAKFNKLLFVLWFLPMENFCSWNALRKDLSLKNFPSVNQLQNTMKWSYSAFYGHRVLTKKKRMWMHIAGKCDYRRNF